MVPVVVVGCFAALGALGAPDGSSGGYVATLGGLGAAAGAVVGLLLAWLLAGLPGTVDRQAPTPTGRPSTATAVWKALLAVVPFTVMAAVAEFALDWNAAGALAAAALVTSCSVAGADTGSGRRSVVATLAPAVLGIAASTGWLVGISAAPHLLSGAGG